MKKLNQIVQFLGSLALLTLALCGCQTTQQVEDPYPYKVPELPYIQSIPIKNEANVRLPETVKAYAIGRYQDPQDPRIMHERHVIYRREQTADWRLASNAERQILVGPTLTDAPLDNRPALMQKELALELKRQRDMYEALKAASEEQKFINAEISQAIQLILEEARKLRTHENPS